MQNRMAGRASYRDISLYAPDRTPCRIDLSDNTNLFGAPPSAVTRLRKASLSRLTRYPSLYSDDLKSAIARYIGVAPECVVTGCGSDDVLDSAIRAFCEPGCSVATSTPSFAMIPLFARMNGVDLLEVPLGADHDVDADALLGANATVTYVCSPNNPTGVAVAAATLQRLMTDASGFVIVDEAYAEFAERSIAQTAPGFPGVLAVRTFSKAFGLAGMRVGYGIGAPELVAEVEKSRGPYKVSALAEEIALAAITDDLDWVRANAAEAVQCREQFSDALRKLGLAPLPSQSNFVLVPVPEAAGLTQRLRDRGVAVRPFSALPGIGDALRISVARWQTLEEVLVALEASLA